MRSALNLCAQQIQHIDDLAANRAHRVGVDLRVPFQPGPVGQRSRSKVVKGCTPGVGEIFARRIETGAPASADLLELAGVGLGPGGEFAVFSEGWYLVRLHRLKGGEQVDERALAFNEP